ncbi:amino acid ABC transporter permease [Campylobacter sp. 19-13652]|uniref:amino acid ABC transporter permease n=1 Tax=Campylobacter sp. 19-13652 TaxID=2840180 RepID=UPI001C7896FD|nr:amino acid ABC transporter permease [Campylobacter sp. 19-13652]BCX78918.1 amino acid ABC transporter permease [Campylobacter sp. 19-13652]
MQGLEILSQSLPRLAQGLLVTLEISFLSMIISLFGGLMLGVAMNAGNKFIKLTLKLGLEIVRVMPQLVWLFIVYFGLSKALNIHISAFSASVIVFSIWGVFEMMDLVRGAIESIPKSQFESAAALGFSKFQIYIYIILPLATRRLVPGAINLFSRIVKTTPIVVLIGVVELLKVGQMVIESNLFEYNYTPFFVYGSIFLIYFAICYPVSLYSKTLERKWG